MPQAGPERLLDAARRLRPATSCPAVDCASCRVRHLTFCGGLELRDLARLASITVGVSLPAHRSLFHERDPAEFVYNLTSGTIKLYRLLPDGRRQITGFVQAGGFLGLAGKAGYSYNAETVTAAELCRYPRRKLADLFMVFPELERRMLELATDELIAAQDQMLLLGRYFAAEKVALFLVDLLERGRPWSRRPSRVVSLMMTRGDIADYLGLTAETLSRTLSQFSRDGLICQHSRTDIELIDVRRLSAIAALS